MTFNNNADLLSADIVANGDWIFNGTVTINGSFLLPALPLGATAYTVYYDPITGITSYAAGGSALDWAIGGNILTGAGTFGSLNPFDISLVASNTEIMRLLNASGSIQLANNGMVLTLFPTAVISSNNDSGAVSIYGGTAQTGAQISLTGTTNAQPSSALFVSNAVFFSADLTSNPYALMAPPGVLIGPNGSFGDATDSVVAFGTATANPTTPGGSGGLLYVSATDSNLYFVNSVSTYQLTPPTPSNTEWLLVGNALASAAKFGSTTAFGWTYIADNITFCTISSNGNVNYNLSTASFQIAYATISFDAQSIINIGAATAIVAINIGNNSLAEFQQEAIQIDIYAQTMLNCQSNGAANYDAMENLVLGGNVNNNTDGATLTIGNIANAPTVYIYGGDLEIGTDVSTGIINFGNSSSAVLQINCADTSALNCSAGFTVNATTWTNQAATIQIGTTGTNTAFFGNSVILNPVTISLPNIGAGTTANILYIDTSTGFVTYGVGGGGGSGWLLTGNSGTTPGTDFVGTTDAKDLVFKTDSVEIMRLVETTKNLQLASNGLIASTFPAAYLTSDSDNNNLLLNGGQVNGAQLVLTGTSSGIGPNLGIFAGNQFQFVQSLASPTVSVTLFPAGIGSGPTVDFGNSTDSVVAIGQTSANPTTIGAAGMILYVSSVDNNLYALNATSTYQLTPTSGGGGGWALAGNSLAAPGVLGSTTAFGWSMVSNNVTFFTVDSSQNVSFMPNTFAVDATTTIEIGLSTATEVIIGSSSNTFSNISGGTVTVLGEVNLSFQTNITGSIDFITLDILFSDQATSTQYGQFNIDGGANWVMTANAGMSLIATAGLLNISTGTGGDVIITTAAVAYLDATSSNQYLQFSASGTSDCNMTLSGALIIGSATSIKVTAGIPTGAANPGVPANLPPTGYNYLIINTTTGVIEQFAA